MGVLVSTSGDVVDTSRGGIFTVPGLVSTFYTSRGDICRGAMDNKELGLWCRRGLLAYVYSGVSDLMNALVAGTALI